jgi:DHA1 family tetracycline resistance protein-like MFS transporter
MTAQPLIDLSWARSSGLLGTLGPRVPFIAAAGLCFQLVVGVFHPAGIAEQKYRREFDWKRANPAGSLLI